MDEAHLDALLNLGEDLGRSGWDVWVWESSTDVRGRIHYREVAVYGAAVPLPPGGGTAFRRGPGPAGGPR